MFKNFIAVGIGGCIGSMLRYAVSFLPIKNFPYPTLIVNIIGSFFIGLIMGIFIKNGAFGNNNYKLFLTTGICGGFTTFSAFAFENFQLVQHGKIFTSILYITISVLISIIAVWLGFKLSN